MKKLFCSKSFLTMMSILSILLGFALLCGASLAALQYFGVVSLFPSENDLSISADANDFSSDFRVYEKTPQAAVGVGTEGIVSEELIKEIPFTDNCYVKLEVHSDTQDGAFAEGVYEIWRYQDKYRIHRYHISDGEVESITICDGERVMMIDFSDASIVYEDYGVTYAFSEMAPIPNFRKLFMDVHSFTYYSENEELCAFSCEYPLLSVTDRVEFYKDTGMISHYQRLHEGRALLSVEVIAISDEYDFEDHMFSFD